MRALYTFGILQNEEKNLDVEINGTQEMVFHFFLQKYYENLRINFRNNYLLKLAFNSSFQSSNFPFVTFQEAARHSIFLFLLIP